MIMTASPTPMTPIHVQKTPRGDVDSVFSI
jgi:hypothetical protein